MEQYQYYSDQIRVRITNDRTVSTTLIALFQRRWLGILWKRVREVNFDVFDYTKLPNGGNSNGQPVNEYSPTPYHPVTIHYGENSSHELWKPQCFDLQTALEKHFEIIMDQQSE